MKLATRCELSFNQDEILDIIMAFTGEDFGYLNDVIYNNILDKETQTLFREMDLHVVGLKFDNEGNLILQCETR